MEPLDVPKKQEQTKRKPTGALKEERKFSERLDQVLGIHNLGMIALQLETDPNSDINIAIDSVDDVA